MLLSRHGQRTTLHVAWATSQLGNHPLWPALIANLVAERRRALPGPAVSALPPGAALRVRLPSGSEQLDLTEADGRPVTLPAGADGDVELPPAGAPGVRTLRAGELTWTITVPACSGGLMDLSATGDADAAAHEPTLDGGGDDPAPRRLLWLLLAATAGAMAWWAHRRET